MASVSLTVVQSTVEQSRAVHGSHGGRSRLPPLATPVKKARGGGKQEGAGVDSPGKKEGTTDAWSPNTVTATGQRDRARKREEARKRNSRANVPVVCLEGTKQCSAGQCKVGVRFGWAPCSAGEERTAGEAARVRLLGRSGGRLRACDGGGGGGRRRRQHAQMQQQ